MPTPPVISAAASTWEAVSPSAVQTMAEAPAALKRYSKSYCCIRFVVGMMIAPSLCRARIVNQN